MSKFEETLRPLTGGIRGFADWFLKITKTRDHYSIWVGLIYIFNLIVGTGALALPAAFSRAGWCLSTISVIFLAFMSYMTATYVIETMACANAVVNWKRLNSTDGSSAPAPATSNQTGASDESSRYYSLDHRVEMGEMANMFFNKTGRILFYLTICIYLYGDLSIYAAAVAKSVTDVICSAVATNATSGKDWERVPCFKTEAHVTGYTRLHVYRIALVIFVLIMGPFVFFNVQKTKYLQLLTTAMRWIAFTVMISLAIHLLISRGAEGHPPTFVVTGMPTLFGACVYAYMCHHSLPGLISPIQDKTKLGGRLSYDYVLITVFYLLLPFTGVFAFAQLHDLYTLNFVPTGKESTSLKIVDYFLSLFPVFTLSTSFPIIAITLRNNLRSLCLDTSRLESYSFAVRKLLFPIVAVVPPITLTYFLENISVLIEFTGSYAGTGIQYLIPTFLVVMARRQCGSLVGIDVVNKYKSPFTHIAWAIFVFVWSCLCVILVSVHIFGKK